MSLINCPECTREVSDKVKICPHCGYPFQDSSSNNNISIQHKNNILKIIIPIIFVIVAIFIYHFLVTAPKNKYNNAISLLEQGKYQEAKILFDKLPNYKDVDIIQEQIKYESITYNCINILKKYLKNPDSYLPYEVTFYIKAEEEKENSKPTCIMYYGAQNGFGGNTTGYALFTYSEEKNVYQLFGTCNKLNIDKDDLNSNNDDYLEDYLEYLTSLLINTLKDTGTEIGEIDMNRLKTVLKNDAYSTIKIIN